MANLEHPIPLFFTILFMAVFLLTGFSLVVIGLVILLGGGWKTALVLGGIAQVTWMAFQARNWRQWWPKRVETQEAKEEKQ